MRTFFAIILMMAAGIVYGQTSPQITVSTEKVKVNGEVLLLHKVKGGETLYSISKAYGVTIDEIVRRNETLKAGLKEGSTIYIPSSTSPATAAGTEVAPVQENAVDNAPATVDIPQAGERKVYDLKKYSRKKKHTVKWWEKIEDVANKYNVSADAIIELNSLETTALKKKQVLYIPNDAFLALMAEQAKEEESLPVMEEAKEEAAEEAPVSDDLLEADFPYNKENDILFILPLNLKDSIAPNSNFMDFYMGALVSIEGDNSRKTNITLVDQLMYSSIDEIISTGVLDGKDVIVGPVRPADMEKVLAETARKSIVLSPMDQNGEKLTQGNPLLVQVPPTLQAQQENIVTLFADKYTPEKNAILIYEKDGVDTAQLRIAENILSSRGITYNTLSYGILEGREILGRMSGYMKGETDNLVLVLSNSEAFVSDVVRNLNLIHTNPVEENRRKITLFGMPRWRNFETIEVDYFHRMNLHLSLPYFVDYNNQRVKDFLMKYRALTNCEPTPFAFQGYDVATIATAICRLFARPISIFINIPEFKIAYNLQLMHNYVRNGEGNGLANRGTTNVVYNNDYTISVTE